ncbi:MAG TPA: hypothetical protein VIM53_03285 [Candidatus Saccharimonadales bacterium]
MAQYYFDLRTQSARGTDSVTADMMRHLHTRQHLGKTLVVDAEPGVVLSAARKQWLRIARSIQTQRASTLNADKILKYTHTITRMHQMEFTLKTPAERPNDDVFFLRPDELALAPAQCFNVYVNAALPKDTVRRLLTQLPDGALITDYCHATPWAELGLKPKAALEDAVAETWNTALKFLEDHRIDIDDLVATPLQNIEAIDDALDTLLAISYPFLEVASAFQRALELARPLRLSKATRNRYDALALLAHRVQALSPSPFQQQFLEVYNEDDSFFLLDNVFGLAGDALARRILAHQRAGRTRLAAALARLPQSKQRFASL